ncbi:S-adenosyl-L-methionine-dependent methyltransferase [Macrophomina phaseolina]|uniref:S-adenosyl-L-methionine-dependent methyltransferase n=1 Tax=Macrophomina phaseolina TaxID=35725 RepID=A0ABQ8GZ36_9PEZI|nr:S-adenosyl-L-methionine-dependent methyltransferase [Macrophomina phaseolina]
MAAPAPPRKDTTFREYTASAARGYASARLSYPPELYSFILSRHAETGGQFGTLVDVGCGPGNATRDLAPAFDHARGIDAGAGMIAAAAQLGGGARDGEIAWKVAGAEEMADAEKTGLEEGSVDLLAAATSAHWFDMPAFWRQAAKLVRPGGSVAIFARSSSYCHPDNPKAGELRRIFTEFEESELSPYRVSGSGLTHEFYSALQLPWDDADPDGGPPAFPRDAFERHLWNVDGALDGAGGTDFFGGSLTLTFPQMEKMLGMMGLVTRWRAAHPGAEGTDGDIVKVVLRRIKEVAETEELKMGTGFALLFFKRK